jgi:hypothetical protein
VPQNVSALALVPPSFRRGMVLFRDLCGVSGHVLALVAATKAPRVSACWLSVTRSERIALCQRIIVGHESANELTLIDSEGMRPNRITIGRNTTSPGLQLGNERVVLDAHPSGQLPLR